MPVLLWGTIVGKGSTKCTAEVQEETVETVFRATQARYSCLLQLRSNLVASQKHAIADCITTLVGWHDLPGPLASHCIPHFQSRFSTLLLGLSHLRCVYSGSQKVSLSKGEIPLGISPKVSVVPLVRA